MAARLMMPLCITIHYVAIVEDAGADKAIGIWFPDLPGCFSAGDDIDDALRNAHEALALYAEAEAQEGRALPKPSLYFCIEVRPAVLPDLRDYMVALVALDSRAVTRRNRMAKKLKRAKAKRSLADDIQAGLQEALKYARVEKTDMIVHRVVPNAANARRARMKLGLSPRSGRCEFLPAAFQTHHPLHRRRRLPGEAGIYRVAERHALKAVL